VRILCVPANHSPAESIAAHHARVRERRSSWIAIVVTRIAAAIFNEELTADFKTSRRLTQITQIKEETESDSSFAVLS